MWDRVRPSGWSLSARLIASYVLVTLAVVLLVEALMLGYQAPRLVDNAQRQSQVGGSVKVLAGQLAQRYPKGVPAGTLLGDSGEQARPGQPQLAGGGNPLIVPAITGPIRGHTTLTAAVLINQDGRIVASSAPSRYPAGRPVASKLPDRAAALIATGRATGGTGAGSIPYGRVAWALAPYRSRPVVYLYVQAPEPTGFINPIRAWEELRQVSGSGPLLWAGYALLIVILPVGVLFGLLATRRIVRRVRRLEQATVAVADGDYTVRLPTSRRDEIGRLEANFATMTSQLGSALSAERKRASGDARAAERTRIAREIHDAISQHLFGLRMIAAGMRKANPDNVQAHAIERVTEEALRDMQALLLELRPAALDGVGLTSALEQTCAAYRDRLGVVVDSEFEDVTLPEAVEDALLRITQEACTNAVRHGNARRLAVSLTRDNGHVDLAVRDTGTGFDPAAPHVGSGLAHIRHRVAELGGSVHMDSVPGRGASLTVRIPVS